MRLCYHENTVAGSADLDAQVRALLAAGEHERAAHALAAGGRPLEAARLFERIWRFAEALELVARVPGQTAWAIRLAADAGQRAHACALARGLPDDDREGLREAAAALSARGLFEDAALAAERAGDLGGAADLYRRAGLPVRAARLMAEAGKLREAVELLQVTLAAAAPRDTPAGEHAEASLLLGDLLARTGRPREAARALQAASADPRLRALAQRALAPVLRTLGLPHAAAFVESRLRWLDGAPASGDGADAPSSPAAAPSSIVARALPERFQVDRMIGAGAAGQVFLAQDRLLGRPVALKLLLVGAGGSEAASVARFLREAEAATRLRHPHIVTLYEADARAGLLVMEYLPGGNLHGALSARGRLPLSSVRRLGLELCAALEAAHRAGIVHRDVKPANIYFDAGGNAKLGDFGAAHVLDLGQTQTGGLIGTLAYLSPEQVTGARIGPAADLYALGATLFEAATGRPPFTGPDFVEQHLSEPAPAASVVVDDLPPELDAILLRALAKLPEDRFPSAAAMAEALRALPVEDAPHAPVPAARLRMPGAQAPEDTPSPAPAAHRAVRELGRTAHGRLTLQHDPRVDREVVVELRERALSDAERAHLRRIARAGGPTVQRLLALPPDGLSVVYEHLPGAADEARPDAAAEDLLALRARAAELDLPGARIVRTEGGPVLLVQPELLPAPAGREAD